MYIDVPHPGKMLAVRGGYARMHPCRECDGNDSHESHIPTPSNKGLLTAWPEKVKKSVRIVFALKNGSACDPLYFFTIAHFSQCCQRFFFAHFSRFFSLFFALFFALFFSLNFAHITVTLFSNTFVHVERLVFEPFPLHPLRGRDPP